MLRRSIPDTGADGSHIGWHDASSRAGWPPQRRFVTADERPVGFNDDIRPIFAEHCVACHGGVKQAGGLSFVYRDNVFAGGDSGQPAVVPGDLDESYLIERVTDPDPETRMPPGEHGPALSAAEIDRLKQWIAAGAKWETPWAFTPPRATPLPDVNDTTWCRVPLDRYVLARLESAAQTPSPPAERGEWLRRVSFDLIGLPPARRTSTSLLPTSSPTLSSASWIGCLLRPISESVGPRSGSTSPAMPTRPATSATRIATSGPFAIG